MTSFVLASWSPTWQHALQFRLRNSKTFLPSGVYYSPVQSGVNFLPALTPLGSLNPWTPYACSVPLTSISPFNHLPL